MLAGCDPFRGVGRGEKPEEPDAYGELIGTFFVEGRNMHLRLLDITDLYQQVTPQGAFLSQNIIVSL